MQNLSKTRKATYRQKFGNIGKLLVMEPPPAPQPPLSPPTASVATASAIPTTSPNLITVGVQYDVSRPISDPFDVTNEQPYLPNPLEPSPVASKAPPRPKMMDAATEFDMADGGGSPAPPSLSNASSRDSLEPHNSGANGGSEHMDRMSVDLADISLSAANGDAIHGASETSDSGFSRSCASEASGTLVDAEEAPPSVFSDATSNSTTPDEGIEDPEPKVNGTASPPQEEEGEEEEEGEDNAPQPPSQESDALIRERQPSEGSLNDSVASSSQSSSTGSHQKGPGIGKPLPALPSAGTGRRGPAKTPQGKTKFSHVSSRIDSGRRRSAPLPGKKRVTFEGLPTPPNHSDDNEAGEAENEEEEEAENEEEEVFVIHHGPGFEEPPQRSHEASGGGSSRIVSFQEPRSLVKQYIKGRQPAGTRMKPRIIRQTTIETAELARKPQRAMPVPQASAHGGAPNIPVKQTNASKKRLEKLRQESAAQLERLQAESSYMTPLQRKEMEVKELRRQLGEAYYIIEQREIELDVFHHEKDREIRFVVEEKNDSIKELEESVEMLHEEVEASKEEAAHLREREEQLQEEINNLKLEAEKKESRHQQLYLEMYKKGRDSADFERQDELEKLALEDSNHVTKEELLKKLSSTQMELEHWQMVKLTEHYDEAAKPETEADAMLKFLKDSMFHYITENKREDVDQHLRAIIRIFKFTDVQMKTINKCLEERKRKGKL